MEDWDIDEPKGCLMYIAFCLLMIVMGLGGQEIYKEYFSLESRLTKVIEKSLIDDSWRVVDLYIYSTETIHKSKIGSKTYKCRFGLIKGVVNGELDIEYCEAPVLYNRKFKPYYNVIGMHKIDE